jgi:hypothetical protein
MGEWREGQRVTKGVKDVQHEQEGTVLLRWRCLSQIKRLIHGTSF